MSDDELVIRLDWPGLAYQPPKPLTGTPEEQWAQLRARTQEYLDEARAGDTGSASGRAWIAELERQLREYHDVPDGMAKLTRELDQQYDELMASRVFGPDGKAVPR